MGAPSAAAQTGPGGSEEIIIPYTATAAGCYAGSTSPKALQEIATDSAWVCVRGFGGSGGGCDGQVLKIQLGDAMTGPRFYKISEIEITPGWVPKTPGGKDDWTKHRVPTLIRYVFTTPPIRDENRPCGMLTPTTPTGRCPTEGPNPCWRRRSPWSSSRHRLRPKMSRRPAQRLAAPSCPVWNRPHPRQPTPPPDPSDATFAVSLLQVKGRLP